MPEIVNVDQAAAWDGPSGDAWVAREAAQNEALRPHSERLLEVAAVGTTDHVLDVGCGTGDTTRACARLALDGDALGVDLSTAMLERARERAAADGLTNLEFLRADAQVHPFPAGRAQVVVSRFGVMFFADPAAAFANIGRGMSAGGRLAMVVWQDFARNEWLRVPWDALAMGRPLAPPVAGTAGPMGLADPDRVRAVLDAGGFRGVALEDLAVPFRFGGDLDAAVAMARDIGMMRSLLADLDADAVARAIDALRTAMAAHETRDGVELESGAWIVTAFR
jgi:SAM-dependent methyltransferase